MKLDLQYFAEEATETEVSAQVEETEQRRQVVHARRSERDRAKAHGTR